MRAFTFAALATLVTGLLLAVGSGIAALVLFADTADALMAAGVTGIGLVWLAIFALILVQP